MYRVIDHKASSLSVRDSCDLARVPRSGYYRQQQPEPSGDPLVAEVRDICQDHTRYGYRRVTRELHRRSIQVNHKRVLALMRKENLLCRKRRKFFHTTDSRHTLRIYPNLVPSVAVTGPHQLWVADITYVHLRNGFAYLAVMLDAFSRRAIGWAISAHIDTSLSLAALRMALTTRPVLPGLVHHSDRGVQYASTEYIALLTSKNIAISMSRKGNPYDNAKAESFIKTLKTEEVDLNEYTTLEEARTNIEHFIDRVYNHKRLHSSLGYVPPAEFEATFINSSTLTREYSVSV